MSPTAPRFGQGLYTKGENLGLSLRGALTRESGGAAMQDRPELAPDGNRLHLTTSTVRVRAATSLARKTRILRMFRCVSTMSFPFGTLTSITAYADAGQDVYGDADFGPVDVVIQDLEFGSEVFNQELRLASNADGWWRWLAARSTRKGMKSLMSSSPSQPNSPFNAGVTILDQQNATTSESYAVFGQLDVDITDRAELTVGVALRRGRPDDGGPAQSRAYSGERYVRQVTAKIQLSYHWSNSYMGYATYSEGFRSGALRKTSFLPTRKPATTNWASRGLSLTDGSS